MKMRGAYRDVLTVRDARLVISASAASQMGDWLYNAALLAYVYTATDSAAWVGAATICRLLPYVLLGPIGGVVADRYDRRAVLLAGDGIRCALMVTIGAIVATEGPVGVVIALTALASAAGTAERPATMALLPRLVGEARLGPANALLHTVQDLGIVLGPAIGAVILTVGSPSLAFMANAGTFAGSAVLISRMRRLPVPGRTRLGESAITDLREGFRAARTTPFALPLFVVVAMAEFTYGAQTVQLVLYAERRLDLGAEGYGYLLAAAGIGGVLSALINGRLATSWRVSVIVVSAGAIFCATQLVYATTDLLVLALVATLIGGAGIVACEVVAETALARVAPDAVLGRVMGVFDALSVAAMVAGAVAAPVLIDRSGLRSSLAVLGAGTLVVTFLCLGGLRGLDVLSKRKADSVASRVAVIERLPIAAGIPQLVLEQIASAAQIVPLPAGVDIVVEGAPAHAFYAIVEGGVIVHRADQEIARLGPGDHFGERGLLDQAPRNASVTTTGDTSVLRIEGTALLEALQAAPAMRSALDRFGGRPPAAEAPTALVDDPTWVPA